jgi:hypothetical protein
MEAHAQASGSRPAEGEAGAPGQAEASGSGQAPFVPSPAFTGARQGYVFKLGREGVGYYLDGAMLLAAGSSHPPPAADSRPKPAKPAPLKPKGMVIKSSSIVKVKGAKPATAPDAKKRKLGGCCGTDWGACGGPGGGAGQGVACARARERGAPALPCPLLSAYTARSSVPGQRGGGGGAAPRALGAWGAHRAARARLLAHGAQPALSARLPCPCSCGRRSQSRQARLPG